MKYNPTASEFFRAAVDCLPIVERLWKGDLADAAAAGGATTGEFLANQAVDIAHEVLCSMGEMDEKTRPFRDEGSAPSGGAECDQCLGVAVLTDDGGWWCDACGIGADPPGTVQEADG